MSCRSNANHQQMGRQHSRRIALMFARPSAGQEAHGWEQIILSAIAVVRLDSMWQSTDFAASQSPFPEYFGLHASVQAWIQKRGTHVILFFLLYPYSLWLTSSR